jgi:hypothetical protein
MSILNNVIVVALWGDFLVTIQLGISRDLNMIYIIFWWCLHGLFSRKQSCELLGLWSAVCLWSRTKLMSLSICHWVAWRISNEGGNTRMNQCVVSEMHVFGDPWWSLLWLFERMMNCMACVFFRWLIHMATLGDPWYFVSLFPDCATLPFNK